MKGHDYEGFVRDLAAEMINLTKDPKIYQSDDFNLGYRAALYTVIHLLELQADSWEIDRSKVGLDNFSADDWRRNGRS